MPIGKNSIKRVANSGYSKVVSTAPDMENSTVIANPSPEVIEKLVTPAIKTEEPKAEKKPRAAKKPAEKKPTEQKPAEKAVGSVSYVNLGGDMPYYLL